MHETKRDTTPAERQTLVEEALESSAANALLSAVLASMPVGVIVCDAGGKMLMNNEQSQEILGEQVGGMVGRPRRDYALYRPDGAPFPTDDMPLARALAQGKTIQGVEILIRRADGEERTLLIGATPVRDETGEIASGVMVFQDVTERKLAVEALRRSERRYHSLYTAMGEGLALHEMVYDDAGEPINYVVVDANPAFESLTGLTACDVVGEDASDVYGTGEPPYLETCARVVDTGEPVSFETYFPSMGKHFFISLFSPDPGRFAAIFTDVTARKETEAERERLLARVREEREHIRRLAEDLMRERNVMETIMAHTDAYLAYLDPDFNFVRVNAAYVRGSGYSREELVGRNHFELFPHAENQAIFEQVRETGKSVTFWAKPFRFADRSELSVTYWDWTLAPVHNAQGRIDGFVLSLVDVTEREQLITQLGQERALLDAVIENAPEAIVVADWEGRIVRANQAAERIYARPVPYGEDFESHGELALCHPDGSPYAPRHLPLTRSAMDGEFFHNLEMSIIWPNGQRRELLAATAPIEDKQGQSLGAVGVFQDVTAIKRAQKTLQRYAERLHGLHETDQAILSAHSLEEVVHSALRYLPRLLDCAQVGVTLYDLERGRVTWLTGRANDEIDLEKTRYEAADPAWRLIIETIVRGRPHIIENLDELSATAASSVFLQKLREDGVRAFTVIPLTIEDELIGSLNVGLATPGKLRGEALEVVNELAVQLAIGIHQARLRDRVQQHAEHLERQVARRTAELRASEARFRAIFESAGVGIARLDRNGCFDECNPALQEMLGYEAEALRGRHFLALAYLDEEIQNEDADADEARFEALMRGASKRCVMQRRYACRDGQTIWARWTISGVCPLQGRGADGQQSTGPHFAIGMMEDITERKEAQEALIQAEKLSLTGRLAASFAHEINNPLQSVIGCLGLAQESLDAVESADLESADLKSADLRSVDDFLQIALEELRRASGIVGQLRDLHRKSEPDERSPGDVNELLEQVILLDKRRCAKHGVEVIWKPDADLPEPNLDGDRMKQVFLNLLINAADAMPEGGELRIATRYDEQTGGLQIVFADSGVGIPEHILPHLFDPFYTTKDEGMGMGLFVSQSIVENHGGRLDVESEVGKGSTFTVWLPVSSQ